MQVYKDIYKTVNDILKSKIPYQKLVTHAYSTFIIYHLYIPKRNIEFRRYVFPYSRW